MKLILTRSNRIDGKAGDIVEVSPERAAFLLSIDAAVPAGKAGEQAGATEPIALKKKTKTTAKRK